MCSYGHKSIKNHPPPTDWLRINESVHGTQGENDMKLLSFLVAMATLVLIFSAGCVPAEEIDKNVSQVNTIYFHPPTNRRLLRLPPKGPLPLFHRANQLYRPSGGTASSSCVPSEEICGDDIDNDCDGLVDVRYHGLIGACVHDGDRCLDGEWEALGGNVYNANLVEICDDGIDNDCDGVVDGEGLEEVCDGIDNDCDGSVDIVTQPEHRNERGRCLHNAYSCGSPLPGNYTPTAEICRNGLDDDCDGIIDEPDCASNCDVRCAEGYLWFDDTLGCVAYSSVRCTYDESSGCGGDGSWSLADFPRDPPLPPTEGGVISCYYSGLAPSDEGGSVSYWCALPSVPDVYGRCAVD